ncbi:MAG: hypothetical protein Ta2E_11370 [Mycoplasmoidaceae bacterium]|nr:MAG: hypothetical protein Ta2E_11370 [Mycoplasmoidaceae bacterium]
MFCVINALKFIPKFSILLLMLLMNHPMMSLMLFSFEIEYLPKSHEIISGNKLFLPVAFYELLLKLLRSLHKNFEKEKIFRNNAILERKVLIPNYIFDLVKQWLNNSVDNFCVVFIFFVHSFNIKRKTLKYIEIFWIFTLQSHRF